MTSPPPDGPPQNFADFYRGHVRRLVVYLLYQGAPAHLAADLAQETMIAVYKQWDTVRSPRAYAWKVAYRAFICRSPDDEVPVAEVPEPTAVLPDPGQAEKWVQKQKVLDVLRALPPRQRQVLALSLDGWTDNEIADLLEINPAAVRSNRVKARRNAGKHCRPGEEDS